MGGRRGVGPVALLALVTLLAAACRPADEATTLERVREAGVARVGFANEAPYAYIDRETGRLTGEAPEIARVVLKRMGVSRIEGVLTEFGALIPGLKAGRFDLIAAGMYVTPERCREIAFTNPTYRIGEALLVRAGNPLDLHSYEDVKRHPRARLGVVAGAVELGYARAVGIPQARLAVLPDPPSAVAAVQAGRVDAYAGTRLTVRDMLGKLAGGGVEQARPFANPVIDGEEAIGHGAFGVRREDDAFREALNRELARFIGSEAHLERVAPFGFTAAELPGDATAASLCRP